jgi:hypothetical protein
MPPISPSCEGGFARVSERFFHDLVRFGLLWLGIMLHYARPSDRPARERRTSKPAPPPRKPATDPKPFADLTRKPHWVACEQGAQGPAVPPPPTPALPIISTRGRPRQVDTSPQFGPHPECAYRGGVRLGNITSNGHPHGSPWRQLDCRQCEGYCVETVGTPFYGQRVSADLLVWAVGALAEGLGMRAVARVFEVDANTVLGGLVEAAAHLQAFSPYFRHDVRVTQLQLDELYALLRAVKDGEIREAEAIKRRSRSPHWVWVVIDPVTKVLLSIAVSTRTLAMAQGFVHHRSV